MNFTSASDFQFVVGANIDTDHPHGDLDRIEIDNNIMPVRTGSLSKVLRGMDIAFLMEAVEERRRAIGLTAKTWTFHSSILKSDIQAILTDVTSLYASSMFLISKPSTAFFDLYVGDWYQRISSRISSLLYTSSDMPSITIEDSLLYEVVSSIFTALGNLKLWITPTSYITTPTAPGTNDSYVSYGVWGDGTIEDEAAEYPFPQLYGEPHGYRTLTTWENYEPSVDEPQRRTMKIVCLKEEDSSVGHYPINHDNLSSRINIPIVWEPQFSKYEKDRCFYFGLQTFNHSMEMTSTSTHPQINFYTQSDVLIENSYGMTIDTLFNQIQSTLSTNINSGPLTPFTIEINFEYNYTLYLREETTVFDLRDRTRWDTAS